MYVIPEYRGKGVNKMILHALEAWAASQRVLVLQLEVYFQNAPAIRAYEKAGFTANLIEMRKTLNGGE
jgi:GNAT superfamily N-acetyltransferase